MYIKQYIYNITFKQISQVSLVLGTWTMRARQVIFQFFFALEVRKRDFERLVRNVSKPNAIPESLWASTIACLPI